MEIDLHIDMRSADAVLRLLEIANAIQYADEVQDIIDVLNCTPDWYFQAGQVDTSRRREIVLAISAISRACKYTLVERSLEAREIR